MLDGKRIFEEKNLKNEGECSEIVISYKVKKLFWWTVLSSDKQAYLSVVLVLGEPELDGILIRHLLVREHQSNSGASASTLWKLDAAQMQVHQH